MIENPSVVKESTVGQHFPRLRDQEIKNFEIKNLSSMLESLDLITRQLAEVQRTRPLLH